MLWEKCIVLYHYDMIEFSSFSISSYNLLHIYINICNCQSNINTFYTRVYHGADGISNFNIGVRGTFLFMTWCNKVFSIITRVWHFQ